MGRQRPNRCWSAVTTIVLGAAAASVTMPARTAAQETGTAAPAIADLAWIAGTWSVRNGEQTIEEHWSPAASNALLGIGRTLAGERMVAFEYLRIEARQNGIFYVAQPNGRPPTSFRLTMIDDSTAVFENPDHDFPKRITYARSGADALTAKVDGGDGGDPSSVLMFTFSRVRR